MSETKTNPAVVSILREKILMGEFPAGKRLAETQAAEALGVSRTPVRIALRSLAQEGLLEKLPARGYRVKEVTVTEITNSVEVRGVLEGLAARQAVEIGCSEHTIEQLKTCLAQGDALFVDGSIDEAGIEAYQQMNETFHDIIINASGNTSIKSALQLNEHFPFASVSAIAYDPNQLDREFHRLKYAHTQHHAIADAMIKGQGARVEALLKEHSLATINHIDLFNSNTYKLYKPRKK